MSNFTVPYTFVGGTKARAEEMNANFLAVKNELNTKVDKNTNGSVVVGTATESTHAVNKGQLEGILDTGLSAKANNTLSNLTYDGNIKFQYMPYSFSKGAINSNGDPDLLDITDNTKVVFNVDENTPLIGVLASGENFERTSITDLVITNLADGIYNLFIGKDGACIPLLNPVYRQKSEPQPLVETSWSQPVLSANGTLGGDVFAVGGTGFSSTYPAWQCFDNNSGTQCGTNTMNQGCNLIVFNPNPLKISKLVITQGGISGVMQPCSGLHLYGSNDNASWEDLSELWTNNSSNKPSMGATATFNITSDSFYKYFKFVMSSANGALGTGLAEIKITATQLCGTNLSNAVWLNTSGKPYTSMKHDGVEWVNFDYVPLPQNITIANGVITSANKAVNYGDNGYDRYLMLPDTSRSTNLTSGISYKAPLNGWIFNGTNLVKPLFIGETFTPSSSGFVFYAMKGE